MATTTASTIPTAAASQNFEKDVQQIQSVFTTGISNMTAYLNEDLNAWKKEVLNVGVVGSSGQGKSSLINTMRGLRPGDIGSAEVGTSETTKVINKYNDPHNPNLIYCDLPGCGTSNFPRDQYIKFVKLNTYDFFLIVSASRFTEDDGWLAKEITKLGKCFYFVRTQIDIDVKNEKEDHPEKRQSDVLRAIRKNCMEELDKLDLKLSLQLRIFLISGKYAYYTKWDFPKLISSLLNNFSGLKQQALLMTIAANSKQTIQQKVEMLRSRIWKVATLSAGIAAVPIPGTSILADTALLINELDTYKEELNLTADLLDKAAKTYGVTRQMIDDKLKGVNKFDPKIVTNLGEFIKTILRTYPAAAIREELLRKIPFAGWFAAGRISFLTMYKVLHDVLDTMEQASIALLEYLTSKQLSQDIEDDDLQSEISELLENSRPELLVQTSKTHPSFPRSVITSATATADARKTKSVKSVRSSKSYCCWCCRR